MPKQLLRAQRRNPPPQNAGPVHRRSLFRAGLGACISLLVWAMPAGRRSSARAQSELPRLAEDDPMAQALMYVEDATTSTASARQDTEFCHNCNNFTGQADATWGPCPIFPGKSVHREGWCSVWVPRQE